MTSLSKGNAWRHKVSVVLSRLGPCRKSRLGDAGDDITVNLKCLELSVECKNQHRVDLPGWWRQAVAQCPPGQYPVLAVHRTGKTSAEDGWAVLSLSAFVELLAALSDMP